MKYNRIKLMGIICLSVHLVAADNFLVKPKQDRRRSIANLKQEITEKLADILKQESKKIEMTARLQQHIYAQIEHIVDNNQAMRLNKSTKPDLTEYLQELKKIELSNNAALTDLEKRITFISTANSPVKPINTILQR